MEESLSKRLETVRRKMEDYEQKGYDKKYEEDWKKLLNELNDIKIKVYKEKIFSDNEEFKDIKTEDIKFMLVAFYQSELIQKFMVNRKNILEFALKFYDEFFNLLQSYEYLSKEQVKKYKKMTHKDEEEENKKKTPQQSFEEMSQNRTEKIEMYKYKKNLSEKLKKIEKDCDKIDENREYWVSYLNINIVKMMESIPMNDKYGNRCNKSHGKNEKRSSIPAPNPQTRRAQKNRNTNNKIPRRFIKFRPEQ